MQLSPAAKELVVKGVNVATVAIQWGFVPFVVYLGFRKGGETMPNGEVVHLTLGSLLWS